MIQRTGLPTKARGGLGFKGAILALGLAALAVLPLVVVLTPGMLPTLVTLLVERQRPRYLSYTVGVLNSAGVLPEDKSRRRRIAPPDASGKRAGGFPSQLLMSRRWSAADLIAFCNFSKARPSIWRTRSREMPYFCDKSSSVVGWSRNRRWVRISRSRSLRWLIALTSRSRPSPTSSRPPT